MQLPTKDINWLIFLAFIVLGIIIAFIIKSL